MIFTADLPHTQLQTNGSFYKPDVTYIPSAVLTAAGQGDATVVTVDQYQRGNTTSIDMAIAFNSQPQSSASAAASAFYKTLSAARQGAAPAPSPASANAMPLGSLPNLANATIRNINQTMASPGEHPAGSGITLCTCPKPICCSLKHLLAQVILDALLCKLCSEPNS